MTDSTIKLQRLVKALAKLAEAQNADFEPGPFRMRLWNLIEDNDLDSDPALPDWLLEFFECLARREEKARTPFVHHAPQTGDTTNFLADLEELITAHYEYSGEHYALTYDALQMQGIIIYEGDCYEVRRRR